MSDLISRQDAMDAIRTSTSKYTGFMEMEMYTDDDAVEAIKALPSAEPDVPERNVGKWIKVGDNSYRCSVCGEVSCCNGNFCPDCGARMVDDE